MLEKKKTKMKKRSMIIMLVLATTIIVGASTAYAKTKTGTTPRGWSYTFVGNYNSSTGAVSGSTKASFSKHEGCYVKLQAYVLNGRKYIDRTAYEENYVEGYSNAGKNNSELRVSHVAYSREGTNSAIASTIY